MRCTTRCVRLVNSVSLALVAALAWFPKARAQSLNIPLQLVESGEGTVLIVNVGIGGAGPRSYLFDTGSALFNAAYSASAFGNVPSQMAGLPTGVTYGYASGTIFTGNVVDASSLTFYPTASSPVGSASAVTLNAVTPSGTPSNFLINAVYDKNGIPINAAVPLQVSSVFPGIYGIFGAGDFAQYVQGTTTDKSKIVMGSVLGQAVVPGTSAGYVVAANGQALRNLDTGAGAVPGSHVNGPQVGQNVTSCSPCVMLGLTPALLAQFTAANTLAWTSPPANWKNAASYFPNSNAPSSWEYGVDLNYSVSNGGKTVSLTNAPSLLDTGTVNYQLNSTSLGLSVNVKTGATFTVSGTAADASTTTDEVFRQGSFPHNVPYRVVIGDNSDLSISGIGFFLANSVLYNLQGQAVAYTSNFVTDTNLTTTASAPLSIGSDSVPLGLAGMISGPGGLSITQGGSATLSGANTYTGATLVNGGYLALVGPGTISSSSGLILSGGGMFDISGVTNGAVIQSLTGDSSGTVALGVNTLVLANASGTFAGTIAGMGGLVLLGGSERLTGTNAYYGPTIVDGGMLEVDGTLVSGSNVTVNAGGVLTGTGLIDPPTVTIASGAILAPGAANMPGTHVTIDGNLVLQPGSFYAVSLNPAAATYAQITGATTLGGGVLAAFASGTYVTKNYVILQSANRISGTFNGLETINLPNNFYAALAYTNNDVLLDLTAALGAQQNIALNRNQQSIANGLDQYFNAGHVLPSNFVALYQLTGTALGTGLNQLSGEAATGAETGAFQMMNEFLTLMLDPYVADRADPATDQNARSEATPRPLAYADQASATAPSALALSSVLTRTNELPRWSAWAAGFGGYTTTLGNPAAGSHDLSARTYGSAAGADYRLDRNSFVGFALAGAGMGWSIGSGLGSGNGDSLQAGIYGGTQFGAAYVGGSLAFSNHWLRTDRLGFMGDRLTANFAAQSYGGRLEGGWHIPLSLGAAERFVVSPYAAVQAQDFLSPTHGETDTGASGFGLVYQSANATDTRSEIGARFETLVSLGNCLSFDLRARAAWAHDWVSTPALGAIFETLPGVSFVVNGASLPRNSALTSLGAEFHVTPAFSILAKFDGDFAGNSETYAGTATLRYVW